MTTSLKHYVQEKLQEGIQPTLPLRILASNKAARKINMKASEKGTVQKAILQSSIR
jgi:hypothetical protein